MSNVVKGIFGGGLMGLMGAAGDRQKKDLANLQREQAAAVAGERARLDEMNAASLSARKGGRRGLLSFVDDSLSQTFGG